VTNHRTIHGCSGCPFLGRYRGDSCSHPRQYKEHGHGLPWYPANAAPDHGAPAACKLRSEPLTITYELANDSPRSDR
jgi:hypothetical protein